MVMTLETDYAVRIVESLSKAGQKIDAHAISVQAEVPLRFTLKILRKLVESGLIISYRGAHGGYRLAREPGRITLREVIESVGGPYMLNRCQQGEYCCTHTTSCRFHEIYNEISALVRTKLDSYNFENLEDGKTEKKKV